MPRTCRKTAASACRATFQIIHPYIIFASGELCGPFRNMTRVQLIGIPGSWEPGANEYCNVTDVYRIALKSLAWRYLKLHDEIADLGVIIAVIADELAPRLTKRNIVGYESASQLPITAGDNPQRLGIESGSAVLYGVNSITVLSKKMSRYQPNRGGECVANNAFHIIAIGRLRTDDKTKEYVAK